MKPLDFLTLIRSVLNNSIQECIVKEYTPDYITRNYKLKLSTIQNTINANQFLNRKDKLKYNQVLNSIALPYYKINHYGTIEKDLQKLVASLPWASIFMKRN